MLIITFLNNPGDRRQKKTRLVQAASSTFGERLPLMFVVLQCEQYEDNDFAK